MVREQTESREISLVSSPDSITDLLGSGCSGSFCVGMRGTSLYCAMLISLMLLILVVGAGRLLLLEPFQVVKILVFGCTYALRERIPQIC